MELDVQLNVPQTKFMGMDNKFCAYVAGYRGGKTWIGVLKRILFALQNPGINQGYFAPTYAQIRDIFYPTLREVCETMPGISCDIKEGNKEVHLYNNLNYIGTIICRSMEKPDTIVGFKIGDALCDEIDTMPVKKAEQAWNRIIGRMSYKGEGVRNGIDVTTTPEGFRFVYNRFKAKNSANYSLMQASTYDNEANLPDDYIDSLLETYGADSPLVQAYLDGQFVNLTSGSIYRQFDRVRCHSDEVMRLPEFDGNGKRKRPGEPLFIGQDFNVGKMASVICVQRDEKSIAVAELKNLLDTPDLIDAVKAKYKHHRVTFYPDSSGQNRKSSGASITDIKLLQDAGFTVVVDHSNPAVKDRIQAVNISLAKGNLLVNTKECPELSKSLEQQVYDDNGEPDKKQGYDHFCFTGDTLIRTPDGLQRIDKMPKEGVVYGADGGLYEYTNCGIKKKNQEIVCVTDTMGYKVQCTPDHMFLTQGGLWTRADKLKGKTLLSLATPFKSTGASAIIYAEPTMQTIKSSQVSGDCIDRYTPTTMAEFLMDCISITKIMTFLITTRATFRLSAIQSIKAFMQGSHLALSGCGVWQTSTGHSLRNGTPVQREANGTGNTTRNTKKNCIKKLSLDAPIASRGTWAQTVAEQAETISVEKAVYPPTDESLALMTSRRTVSAAANRLQVTNILKDDIAVEAVQPLTSMQDVYCLTVPDHGCFALGNGVIVGNCDGLGYYTHKQHPVRKPAQSRMTTGFIG